MSGFVLPTKSEVGYLDPEIAGEGERVIYSDGETVTWTPPPVKPVMPDFSEIKSLKKYFGRQGFVPWPAWLYHPTEEPRLVKNAQEAAELGVCYRETTNDERARYGKRAMWDWRDDSKWRPEPYPNTMKFDPKKPGQGKTFVPTPPNPIAAQNSLAEALIPQVAAAVAKALQTSGPAAPAHVDPKQWDEFLAFQAFQKTQQAVKEAVKEPSLTVEKPEEAAEVEPSTPQENALGPMSEAQERRMWEREARSRGVRIDGRWSLERLKAEVERAA